MDQFPSIGIEIVVARYREDLRWTENLPYLVTVYDKGQGAFPNIGREAHTYLYHIVHRYESMAEWTVFCQGHPFDHAPHLLEKLAMLPNSQDDYVDLGEYFHRDDASGSPTAIGWDLDLPRAWSVTYPDQPCPAYFDFSAGAQFAVRRTKIQQNPPAYYQRLLQYSIEEPKAPWELERLWPKLFQNHSLGSADETRVTEKDLQGPEQSHNIWEGAMTAEKLYAGLSFLQTASYEVLSDTQCVALLIRAIGFAPDMRGIYGPDVIYMNPDQGLVQQPNELAELLVFLSRYRPCRILEIGTYHGWTTAVLTAYLRRWNEQAHCISVDPNRYCTEIGRFEQLAIHLHQGTSADFDRQSFDVCFIDGDHNYDSVRSDYEHVGRFSPICVFHDIDDALIARECSGGGVPQLWTELKQQEKETAHFYEFIHHCTEPKVMGIGVRIQADFLKEQSSVVSILHGESIECRQY